MSGCSLRLVVLTAFAPVWLGLSDKEYIDLLRKKAVAVTKRDKKRGGIYSVKESIGVSIRHITVAMVLIHKTDRSSTQSFSINTTTTSPRKNARLTRDASRYFRRLITSKRSRWLTFKSSAGRPTMPREIWLLMTSSLFAAELFITRAFISSA